MTRRLLESFMRVEESFGLSDPQGHLESRIKEVREKILFQNYLERRFVYHFFKRIFDISIALLLVVVLSPLLLSLLVACSFFFEGPALFCQLRVGQGGRLFWIFKFRSLHLHHVKKGFEALPFRKIECPTSSNAFGRFIRNYKLDELAQLINVLKGDMSLVGPRPFSIEDSLFVSKFYDRRFYPKPGMTGLWQANYSSLSSVRAKILVDCLYTRKAGFLLDLACLFRTLRIVCLGEKNAPLILDRGRSLSYTELELIKSKMRFKKAS